MELLVAEIDRLVQMALAEDMPWGDVTTDPLIDTSWQAEGRVLAKAEGVIAGLLVMERVFLLVEPTIQVEVSARDGQPVVPGETLATVRGPAASLLRAERVALNFLQQLSGVATLTARFVGAVADLPCRIVDTRKTTPGLRRLEKYAVRMGGGHNHRFSLSDGVLLKDNHLALLRAQGKSLRVALAETRQRIPHGLRIEVEVETLEELAEALEAGADIVLLDNMAPPLLREAVALTRGRALTEASGGVSLQSVRAIAETGVDLISVGALTHSAPALDLSLEIY
ncbi:MAG: carboxylating nicotinate-nucleotide diphosphorylase [Ardenticatenales bacterium]|nr:carboxylating nicotinate-nucleotide diphosphorylase [Ardenticatenales bacterium]